MNKKIIACSLLGMNRLSYSDDKHTFDMEKFKFKNVKYLSKVSEKEKTASSLFYEMMNVFHNKIDSDDIKFIFDRGTLGRKTEKEFSKELKKSYKEFNEDAYVIIVAKSYGTVDTLRALKKIKDVKVDLLVLIDGNAPIWSKYNVSKLTRMYGSVDRVLEVPSQVKEVYTVVQKSKGIRGMYSNRGLQFTLEPAYLNSHHHVYDHYNDGYVRNLKVDHNDMEEIVYTVPCFEYRGNMVTLDTLIENKIKDM